MSQDAGGRPYVRVFDDGIGEVGNGDAYDPAFRGGVRVALCDLNGDGRPDLVTAPGPGMPPLVRVFDGRAGALTLVIPVYDMAFLGGVFVACGDVNGDGTPDIVTAADAGGGPHVPPPAGSGFDF